MVKRAQVKYKKAPQAPRRFKSSYMFFSTEKHKQIRKELAEKGEIEKVGETIILRWNSDSPLFSPIILWLHNRLMLNNCLSYLLRKQMATTEVAKMVSKAWKSLSAEEREEWEEMARRDKARYEVEKTMYTGPWKVPAKKRSQKDPNAPKRPMSAFLSFSNSKRAQVKEEHPNIGNAEVSRILAQMWKDAPDDERKVHIDKEYRLRQQYKTAIAAWRKNCEDEMEAARKVREDEALRTVLATASKTTDDQTELDYAAQHIEEYAGSHQHQYQHPSQGGPPMQMMNNHGQPNAGQQHPYGGMQQQHHHQAYAQPAYPHHYGYSGGYEEQPAQTESGAYPSAGGQYNDKAPPPPVDGYGQHYYTGYGHPHHHQQGYGTYDESIVDNEFGQALTTSIAVVAAAVIDMSGNADPSAMPYYGGGGYPQDSYPPQQYYPGAAGPPPNSYSYGGY